MVLKITNIQVPLLSMNVQAKDTDICVSGSDVQDFFLENKDNCNQFYRCVEGVAYIHSCPKGIKWSKEMSTCDFNTNAQFGNYRKNARDLPTKSGSKRYPGILSNYDYRQMTPYGLLSETANIMKV